MIVLHRRLASFPVVVFLLLSMLLCGSAFAANAPVLAVVGLKTYAPQPADCGWVGVAVGESVCARLSGPNGATGLQQVERVDLAEVLRRNGVDPVAEDGARANDLRQADDERVAKTCRLVRDKLPELAKRDQTATEARAAEGVSVPQVTPQGGRLYGASHLILGCVLLERPWGSGGKISAALRVADVATGVIKEGGGCEASADATVEGLQQLSVALTEQLCRNLGGDASKSDLALHAEPPEPYRLHAEACRLLYLGDTKGALATAGLARQAASPELLPSLLKLQSEAYRSGWQAAKARGDEAEAQRLLRAWGADTSKDEDDLTAAAAAAAFYKAEQLRLGEQRYAEAAAKYRKALALGKDDADTWFGLAYCLYEQRQYAESVEAYTHVLALKPDDAVAYYNRGILYQRLQQYDKALADCTRALELKPDDAVAYGGRGIVYCALQQYDKALADYTRVIELQPNDAIAHSGYSAMDPSIPKSQREPPVLPTEYGISSSTRALASKADLAGAYCNRGWVYYLLQQYGKAIADEREAVELAPTDVPALGNLALTLLAAGRPAEAVAQYRRLVEIGAQTALDAECGKDLTDLLAKQSQLALAHFCLGLLCDGAGQKAEAIKAYQAYVKAQPAGPCVREAQERLQALGR